MSITHSRLLQHVVKFGLSLKELLYLFNKFVLRVGSWMAFGRWSTTYKRKTFTINYDGWKQIFNGHKPYKVLLE